MNIASLPQTIAICDTTLCDIEFTPQLSLSLQQKILLAQLLAEMGVNVIQVGFPGRSDKQLDELFILSKRLKEVTLCGAAGSQLEEIARVAVALKPASRGRINILTAIDRPNSKSIHPTDLLDQIRDSVSLARDYCVEVAWSAIDVAGDQIDFLCRSIETAICSGATVITLMPGSTIDPIKFIELLQQIMHRVVNIEQASVGMSWHHPNFTIDMILSLLSCGIKHIEGSVSQLNRYIHKAQEPIGWDRMISTINHPKKRTQCQIPYLTSIDLTLIEQAEAVLDSGCSPHFGSINKIPQAWGK